MISPAAIANGLIVRMPVYNDWKPVGMLWQQVDQVLAAHRNVTKYPGEELEVVAAATVWKAHLVQQLRRCLGWRVLEVGAGVGETTPALAPTCNHFLESHGKVLT